MKKFLVLSFLCCFSAYAQTFEGIIKSDTIYFYFPSDNKQVKKTFYINNSIKDTMFLYSYLKKDENKFLTFRHSKYENFDTQFAGIETYKKYHKKRFLKSNKQRLITIDFLNELGAKRNIIVRNLKRKKLFIIDEEEVKRKKILIRQIFLNDEELGLANDVHELDEFLVFKTHFIQPLYKKYQFDDKFITFLVPNIKSTTIGEDLYILYEPKKFAIKDSISEGYDKWNNGKHPNHMVREQYNFRLRINNQIVFFQLTHKRNSTTDLERKYDLFAKQHETISFEDLNNFSEKQLEELFARTRNIYIIEDFVKNKYVIPKLVTATSELVDFVRNNN